MTHPRRAGFAALAASALLGLALLGSLSGCETAAQDFGDLMNFNTPTPTEAASWMFHRDAEKRRLGITLIANSYFGGEEPYLKVYREAIADPDPMVRAACAAALGLHGSPEDAPALARLLKDQSELVRWESAKSLQRLYNEEAVGALIDAAVNDSSVDVRMASANALGQYRQHRVLEALIRALDDRSLGVSFHAQRSLRILTGENFGSHPSAWLDWSRSAEAPFAKARTYTYPVYRRDATFLETFTPIRKPVFEEPGVPAGWPYSVSAGAAGDSPAGPGS